MTVFNENDNIVYMPNNNSTNKAQIVKINNYKYPATEPCKNKFVKLDELLKFFLHIELREYILQKILKNKIEGIKLKT